MPWCSSSRWRTRAATTRPSCNACGRCSRSSSAGRRCPRPTPCWPKLLKTREGWHLFLYPFAGRPVHLGLASLIAWRVAQHQPRTFSIAVNDYGFELLSAAEVDWPALLPQVLAPRATASQRSCCTRCSPRLNATELARRRFREIARVSGLIFQGYPGERRSNKQLQASSSLFYEVFRKYDPANRLLQQAEEELLAQELEIGRLRASLARMATQRLVLQTPAAAHALCLSADGGAAFARSCRTRAWPTASRAWWRSSSRPRAARCEAADAEQRAGRRWRFGQEAGGRHAASARWPDFTRARKKSRPRGARDNLRVFAARASGTLDACMPLPPACRLELAGQPSNFCPSEPSGGRPATCCSWPIFTLARRPAFRALGQPVPQRHHQQNLARLDRLIGRTRPREIVVPRRLPACRAGAHAAAAGSARSLARTQRGAGLHAGARQPRQPRRRSAALAVASTIVDEPLSDRPFRRLPPPAAPSDALRARRPPPSGLQAARHVAATACACPASCARAAPDPARLRRIHRRLAGGGCAGPALLRRRRRCRVALAELSSATSSSCHKPPRLPAATTCANTPST